MSWLTLCILFLGWNVNKDMPISSIYTGKQLTPLPEPVVGISYLKLMGMCCWMGWHFHGGIDNTGVHCSVLDDWVGGPDGKIVLTKSQIFSHPARPNSVTRVLSYLSLWSERWVGEDPGVEVESDNKYFIVWPRKYVCGSICLVPRAFFQGHGTRFSDPKTWHVRPSYGTFFSYYGHDKTGY